MAAFLQLELENFKTYRLHTKIEWKLVSSIIGQNGTGKSTIIDAFEYVFCFPRYTKRSVESLQRELYNKNSEEDEHSSSWVSATVNVGNQKREFRRTVEYNDSAHSYRIDNREVDLNEYKRHLLEINIYSKANNFLVQQNTIESLAIKNAKQRREFFEVLSNSIEFKSEYDRLMKEMKSLESEANSLQNSLNLYKKEKNILIQKNKEIKMYHELSEQLKIIEYEYYYTKLYKNKTTIDKWSDERQEKQNILRVTESLANEYKKNIKNLKDQINEKKREILDIEEKLASDEAEHLSYESEGIALSHKIVCCENQIKKIDKHLEKAKELHKMCRKKIEDLRNQLDEVQGQVDELLSQSSSIDLESDQYNEYLELKAEARKQLAQVNYSILTLKGQYNSTQCQINEYENKKGRLLDDIKMRELALQHIISKNESFDRKIEETESYIRSAQTDWNNLDLEINQLRDNIDDTNKSIEEINEKLNDFDVTHQEVSRSRKATEVLNALKAQFPGVIGRVKDLCRVTDQRCEIAITKILGDKMDNILVDTTATGEKCLQFIKEKYKEDRHSVIERFHPLDKLKVKTLPEPLLREIKKTPNAKLAINVMDVGTIGIALKSFIGHVVICRTDVQAAEFSRLQRVNCVSLDGTYFKKDGMFSGGYSDMRKQTKKWNIKEYECAQKKKLDKKEILETLQQQLRKKENLKEDLQSKLSKLRHCLNKYLKPALEDHKKQLEEKERELEKAKKELEDFESKNSSIDELRESLLNIDNELRAIKTRKDEVEDEVFLSFCKKYKLKNIRQYEANDVRKHEDRYKRRLASENHLDEIKNQIAFEESRDTKATIKQYKRKKQELITEHEELMKENKQRQNRKNESSQYSENKAKMKSLKIEINKFEENLKIQERQFLAAKKDLKELENVVASYTAKISRLRRLEIHRILSNCKVKGIEIPIQDGTIADVLMQSRVDIETESSGQQTESDSAIQEKDVVFDFSGLNDSIKKLDGDELDEHINFLENKYKEFEEKLESCVPSNRNMKEDLKLLNNKIKDTNENLSAKQEKYKSIKKEFEDVKIKRRKSFVDFFESVKKEIDGIYKRLYKDTAAQAFISMTNEDEPYLDNIEFSCLPPRKMFTKIENLSGGERTMCALALFLAIYSAKPPPCIILDEIDVALDNDNLENIISLIKEWKVARKTQVIIISHHERLLRCADAVIGINISTRENSSYAIHVDLAQYLEHGYVVQRDLSSLLTDDPTNRSH